MTADTQSSETTSDLVEFLDLPVDLANSDIEEHLPIFEELITELQVELDF